MSLCNRRQQSLWTIDKIVKSPHKDIDIPRRTINDHIWENLEKWADKTALVCGITNRSYTYNQLYKYSRNFAARLRTHLKIKEGDVVCIMMSNSPEYAVVALGALEAGAVVTTVNPIYTPHEVQRQIELSDPTLLIGQTETISCLKEALFLVKKNLPIITVKGSESTIPSGTISFEELALGDNVDHSVLKEVSRSFEDIAFLPYSSGTTGLPKGVELPHKQMVVNCLQQDVNTIRQYDETTSTNQDVTLNILPLYHIYGLTVILLHKLSIGSKIVTVPKFQPNTFINVLKEHPINMLYAAPPLILFLSSHPGVTEEHLASVKVIASGAAPLPTSDVIKLLEKTKPAVNFVNLYGMTECSPLVTAMSLGSNNYSTVGHAVSNTELRIADSELKPLGVNEVGELLIRGPQVMKGYRNNPEATKDAIINDGWYRSGDLGSIDKDGVVTITDRLKELIKVKGYQVPPAELEHILKEHPDVLDVAIVGVPHSRIGEYPKAFIVLKEGRKADVDGITSFVNKQVAEYKRVKEVMFLDALPRNPSGKILRRILKEKYC
ncbi:unnamed protein product [Arctia plantaginis]|uniref:Luciferin 4-monooxygenase n=1 Tax=Arctia plantaginis TaxID=874455 RepID=A0A8S1B0V9_ARCPL|nr:unnamed protein product [Arctia plantaginis]CAB3255935.1 unnamed protein product [Arctia plantaginis]